MLIKNGKDLKVGDEIIVPSLDTFKYLKILRLPDGKQLLRYKCSINKEKITSNSMGYSWTVFNCTDKGHNAVYYIDLNYKDCWLIKREEKC